MKNNRKGFTLIELLIVIALLGALAVALLAALDPLEQIKKGTDTGVRNTVSEISSSFTRYASVKSGAMPYASTIDWGTVGTTAGSPAYDAIASVITTGELKTDFMSLAKDQLSKIFVVADQTRSYVCFAPGAKAFKSDANAKFVAPAAGTTTMVEDTTCYAGTGTPGTNDSGAVCYWCVR
jgi:prepilin-type N-terminal cleavage/methylation domain-containing protein